MVKRSKSKKTASSLSSLSSSSHPPPNPIPTPSPRPPLDWLTDTETWLTALRSGSRLVAFDDEHHIPPTRNAGSPLLEIGLCVFDPQRLPRELHRAFANPAWLPSAIAALQTQHVRVAETEEAGLVNDRSVGKRFVVCDGGCQGHALYCATQVRDAAAIGAVVTACLNVRASNDNDDSADNKGGTDTFIPTVLLLQGGAGDVKALRALGVDLAAPHLALVDLQHVNPVRVGTDNVQHPLALRYAVKELGLSYAHAHNSANDAAWTLMSGLATGVRLLVAQDTGAVLSLAPPLWRPGEVFVPSIAAAERALREGFGGPSVEGEEE